MNVFSLKKFLIVGDDGGCSSSVLLLEECEVYYITYILCVVVYTTAHCVYQ